LQGQPARDGRLSGPEAGGRLFATRRKTVAAREAEARGARAGFSWALLLQKEVPPLRQEQEKQEAIEGIHRQTTLRVYADLPPA